VRREVERRLGQTTYDLVHAEQLQAWPQCEGARRRGIPVLLRAQNVEADLWAGLAAPRPRWAPLARRAAARPARDEAEAGREASATVALTARGADRLRALAGPEAAVHHVSAPFAEHLPAPSEPLPGTPAVVLLAGGWLPNREGAEWVVREAWPAVRARAPRAVLHVFRGRGGLPRATGAGAPPPPPRSPAMVAPGAIRAVPPRVASGARWKVLGGWARGGPVVATPEAAAGLDVDGGELALARSADGFAEAVHRLLADPALAAASVEAGRAVLRRHHDPQ